MRYNPLWATERQNPEIFVEKKSLLINVNLLIISSFLSKIKFNNFHTDYMYCFSKSLKYINRGISKFFLFSSI